MDVLYEDNHVLVVNKPAGLPTMGVAAEIPSLLSCARDYIKLKYLKPGNVYLGIVSRLDAPVTGAVVIARTSKAASRLALQFRGRSVHKGYLALVESSLQPASGSLHSWLIKDERHRRMHITGAGTPGAQHASLSYRSVHHARDITMVEITLETGRKHQIRVQFAQAGHPLVGDRKYGSRRNFPRGIALHAAVVEFRHPTRATTVRVLAPLPEYWGRIVPQVWLAPGNF